MGIEWDFVGFDGDSLGFLTAQNGMYPVIQPSYQYGKWMNIAHLAP
jgi:hypothetical protein